MSSKIKNTIMVRNPYANFLSGLYDPALIGYTESNAPVYDAEACLQCLVDEGRSRKEAEIEFSFLANNSHSEVGPVFIHFVES